MRGRRDNARRSRAYQLVQENNTNIIENHVNIRTSLSLRAGTAIILLLCAGACTQRADDPRRADSAADAGGAPRTAKPGAQPAATLKKTSDPDAIWSGISGGHAFRWLK